jgi:membrane-associated phospholipid phosphatase
MPAVRRLGVLLLLAVAAAVPAAAQDPLPTPGGWSGLLGDIARDYAHFLSTDNATIATAGLTAAATVHLGDDRAVDATAGPTPAVLKPGATYGNLAFQFPLALAWWVTGHAAGSSRAADAGRDLVRAQISAASWTYVIKYAVDRTRPNGDPRSFPSGHASASFATAMVLQEHYGWKLGVPMLLVAAYVCGERVTNTKHFPSDVVFGAAVGVMSGHTVTLRLRQRRLLIAPQARPGGGGAVVHVSF